MNKTKILILGGGFGGLHAAKNLERLARRDNDIEIALVNSENYFVFQPMLPEVISGNVGVLDTVSPLQRLLPNTRLYIRSIHSVDFANQIVTLEPSFGTETLSIQYDHVIVALGTATDFRTTPGMRGHVFPFKDLTDAIRLRNQVIRTLEEASIETDPAARKRLLSYVIAGGGFSGVEIAAELNDFVKRATRTFPHLDPNDTRVFLVHDHDQILKREVSPVLASHAHRILERRGVRILMNTRVESATADLVRMGNGKSIEARTLVSTVPSYPQVLVEGFPLPKERGRIVVDRHLAVQGFENVWALGDCALIPTAAEGMYCPPTGQYAVREGAHVARNVLASIRGDELTEFQYTEHGRMAALGHRSAIAQIFGRIRLSGWPAYVLWRTAYWWMLPGIDRKIRVGIDWFLDLLLPRDLVEINLKSRSDQPSGHPVYPKDKSKGE